MHLYNFIIEIKHILGGVWVAFFLVGGGVFFCFARFKRLETKVSILLKSYISFAHRN